MPNFSSWSAQGSSRPNLFCIQILPWHSSLQCCFSLPMGEYVLCLQRNAVTRLQGCLAMDWNWPARHWIFHYFPPRRRAAHFLRRRDACKSHCPVPFFGAPGCVLLCADCHTFDLWTTVTGEMVVPALVAQVQTLTSRKALFASVAIALCGCILVYTLISRTVEARSR